MERRQGVAQLHTLQLVSLLPGFFGFGGLEFILRLDFRNVFGP